MKSKYFTLLLICLYSLKCFPQIDDITFRRISPPGGFGFQAVHTIKQDLMGYIWFGSYDGIIRYDSKDVIRFIHQPGKKNSLPNNRVSDIAIDNKNNIWVATAGGLCLFNHKKQCFERVRYTYENGKAANKLITSIALDGDGKLWICDYNFIGFLDQEKKQLIRVTKGLSESPWLLYTDDTNRLWLGTQNGTVYLVDTSGNKIKKIIDGPGSYVSTIFAANNQIWVGYSTHGARLYGLDGNLIKHYTYPANPEFNFETANIREIWRDTQGRIWIGSYYGLFLDTGTELIRFDSKDYKGIPHNSIYGIYEDKQGGIWISTWSGGVAYLHHSDNQFNTFRHSLAPNTVTANMISSFAQTPTGSIFVGTEQDGLNQFNPITKSFKKIDVIEKGGILNIKSLCADDYGGLWVGTAFNGLFYRKHGDEKFEHFWLRPQNGLPSSRVQVYSLCKSDSGIWIGATTQNLLFYSFKEKRIKSLADQAHLSPLKYKPIRSLIVDSKDNLWLATLSGMFQLHLPTRKLKRFDTSPRADYRTQTSAFYFITELSDGRIWMGTRANGIHIYNPVTNDLSYFDANGFLKGYDVYGIIERYDNSIWITSNNGLILYEPQKNTFRRFDITDGIQGNLFNPGAIFNDSNNNLYFGGTNGLTLIGTSRIKKNQLAPNVLISKVEINDRKIIPSQKDINKFEKLVLAPKENTLKFHFSTDNYLLSQKNRFKYRLTNYFNEWVGENKEGTASFFNVPAGEYIFEVIACNNDGVWNNIPAKLPVVIRQYWYKSHLALIIYSIILILVMLGIFTFFRERAVLKKTILIEKIKHEHEDKLNEMKLRFFTDISHEFRTPLTLISGPVKNLLKANDLSPNQIDQLNTIKRNTNRLLRLINQIMDLRKVEKGKVKLNISKIDLIGFVNERILNFSEEAKLKNIHLVFNHDNRNPYIEADEEKLDKIIYNILSNAFKFTNENGQITVTIQNNEEQKNNYFSNQLSFGKIEKEDFIEIQVVDNGPGIDSDDLPYIFDRFEQGKKNKSNKYSTGIGLNLCKEFTLLHRGVIIVQTTPGEGTSFSIKIPTKQKAQKILYSNQENIKNINTQQPHKLSVKKTKLKNESINLLIVEDNQDLRKYITTFLEEYYTILSAENGKQGLEVLKTHNIQLIISDIMMPVMDGFEFCQTVKSEIETCHIPVILLTALSSSENTTSGLEKGADAYISKPFDEDVLLAQIDNLIEQRKRLHENYTHKFISQQPLEIGSLDNYFLNKVNAVIEKNIENEEFSVDKLASELGFSRSQLHRKLKQLSNRTSSEYIMMVRIRKAITLLATKNYSIDEVAFRTGFNSHSYFSKCFKKVTQKSPKEYMKEL